MVIGGDNLKLTFKIIFIIIIIGIVFTAFGAISILSGWYGFKPKKADCIIVLGCSVYGTVPSPFLKARTDEALRLYKLGYGKYIIASGGQGANENITEAQAMKRYLISKGMDPSKILTEESSTSTMTNLINSKKIMDLKKFKSAVVVSNSYHLKRASLMAKVVGINASYSGVFISKYKSQEVSGFLREILAIMKFYILG